MNPLSWILPSGTTSFYHSPVSVDLKRKASETTKHEVSKISMAELCTSSIPATCPLNPLLFNGHLQTAWAAIQNPDAPIYYKRKTFESNHFNYNGQFSVDFVVPLYQVAPSESLPERTTFFTDQEFAALPSEDSEPMLVVLHGISGGSYEGYLREVLAPLVVDGGWKACVVNSRGCANSTITSPVFYNPRSTWDIRQTIHWLRKHFPNRPLFGMGFSIGANILANYLGEEGISCQLNAAVMCSNPWNLEVCSLALQRSRIGSEVYLRTMATNLKAIFLKNIDQMSRNPLIDAERVLKITHLAEFDREYQCPSWGYPTEGAYYRDTSSVDSLFAIRVPFLAIQAEDDSISVKEAIPYAAFTKTPYGVLCTTRRGGHLGWFEFGGGRWLAKAIAGFLKKFIEEVDLKSFNVSELNLEQGMGSGQETIKFSPKEIFNPMRRKVASIG